MSDCILTPIAEKREITSHLDGAAVFLNTFVCEVCGQKRWSCDTDPKRVHAQCRVLAPPPPPPPSIFKKLGTFTVAAIKHVAAGLPTCSQEQIDERLAICRRCPGDEKAPQGYWLPDAENPELGSCANCGCSVGRDEKFLNKLAWADQHCPINAWPKIS